MVKLKMAVGRDGKKRGPRFFPTSSTHADFVPAQKAYTILRTKKKLFVRCQMFTPSITGYVCGGVLSCWMDPPHPSQQYALFDRR